jgi:hypothetical protein
MMGSRTPNPGGTTVIKKLIYAIAATYLVKKYVMPHFKHETVEETTSPPTTEP